MLAKLKNRIAFTFLPFLHFMYRVLNRLDLLFPKVLIAYLFKINSLIRVKLGDWVLNYVVEREHVSFDADCPSSVDKTIGSIVWMFWYTGYNSAPEMVRCCIDRGRSIPGIDFRFLTKDNLPAEMNEEIKIGGQGAVEAFESGMISIQQFSDLLRHYLLFHFGGFWLDATIFIVDPNFVSANANKPFYTVKYRNSNLFNKGLFSSFVVGSAAGGIFISHAYNLFCAYYRCFSRPVEYLLIDLIWFYIYRNGGVLTKEVVDSVPVSSDIFNMWDLASRMNLEESEEFDRIMKRNSLQKITYRGKDTRKAVTNPLSMYGRLLTYKGGR